jgi:hypothetical protein
VVVGLNVDTPYSLARLDLSGGDFAIVGPGWPGDLPGG